MKDEEMAEEYADNISGLELTCSLLSAKDKSHAYRLGRYDGFLAGLKAGRPQWHDLRKDPTDLPKGYAENTRFLCSVKGETLFLIRYGSFWQSNFEVDAWCEIPTFDKE